MKLARGARVTTILGQYFPQTPGDIYTYPKIRARKLFPAIDAALRCGSPRRARDY